MILNTKPDKSKIKAIKRLYKTSFPRNERKPFLMIKQCRNKNNADIISIESDNGRFLGLAVTLMNDDYVLLDYFAVADNMRSKGIGTEAIRLLKERYKGRKFFLEAESGDDDLKSRRRNFYSRNGLSPSEYKVSLFGVPMVIFSDNTKITFEEYKSLYLDVLGKYTDSFVKKI